MWNYVYFLAYLEEKDPTEYNGNETYVSEMLKNFDVSWIPNKQYNLKVFF